MVGYACPYCQSPLFQRPLSSIGVGNVKVWRGCADCFPTAIIDALAALNLPSRQSSPPPTERWWLIDRPAPADAEEGGTR